MLYTNVLRHHYCHLSLHQGGIISRLRDVPVLFQHLRQDFVRIRGGLPVCSKLYFLMVGLALLIYLVSPIDLIPEGLFGIFGLADDLFVLVCTVVYATGVYRAYVASLEP